MGCTGSKYSFRSLRFRSFRRRRRRPFIRRRSLPTSSLEHRIDSVRRSASIGDLSKDVEDESKSDEPLPSSGDLDKGTEAQSKLYPHLPSLATLGVNNKAAANNASAFDIPTRNDEAIERLVKSVLDNKISKSNLFHLSEVFKVNIENLDDSTIKERIISELLDFHKQIRRALPSASTANSDNSVKMIDDSTLAEGVIRRILSLDSNNELYTSHRSNLSDLAETLGINIENLEDSALKEKVINRLLDLNNEAYKGLPPLPSATAASNNNAVVDEISTLNARLIQGLSASDSDNERYATQASSSTATTSGISDNEWWENSKYFDRLELESNESVTKPEEPLKFGDCYIFNYQKFEDGFEACPGSANDVARLRHDFHALDFNVYSDFLDLTKEQTLDILKQAAKNDHAKNKCFVCCFLTHGEDGSLLTSNGYLKVDDILECFSRSACESLAGKPKIFIFEACGENICGVEGSESHKKIPDYQDFLLLYSTYEGKLSSDEEQEDNNRGSFFVNELCRTLEQFSVDTDLFQILTILNFRVAQFRLSHTEEEEVDRTKYLPGFTSRLTTELIFNKKIPTYISGDTKYFDTRRRTFCRLGSKSTKKPLEDKKFYNIGQSKRIKFLLLLNTKNNFDKELLSSASSLWIRVTKRDYRSSILPNWSEEELLNFSKEVVARGFANTDCLVCFIVCKAEGQYLWDAYGKKIIKKDLVEQFTRKESQELRGKPKIFIFLTASPTKETWTSCFFADITDNDEDSTTPVHSDLLDITITITNKKQLKDVIGKFSEIFGKECSEDFLSQLTKINKEFTKDYVLADASKKSPPLKAATEKPSPVTAKLPPTVDSKPQKPRNAWERMVQMFSSSRNPNRTPRIPRIPPQNSVSRQDSAKEESKVKQNRATFCFNSTLTATLILNSITVPKLTEKNSSLTETSI